MANNQSTNKKIAIGTHAPGIRGVLEAEVAPVARAQGLTPAVVENHDFDDFAAAIANGTVQAAIVPAALAPRIAATGVLQDLNRLEEQLSSEGAPRYYFRENVLGLRLTQLDSVLVFPICDGDGLSDEELLLLLLILIWLLCDREKRVEPIDKNTFEWEINGPAEVGKEDQETCSLQTYQIRTRAENAVLQHILWNKKPPPGGRSVERTALDDEGDAPEGKIPSKSSLANRTWEVPFCSPGDFILEVTVVWKCLLNGRVHKETKTRTIKALG